MRIDGVVDYALGLSTGDGRQVALKRGRFDEETKGSKAIPTSSLRPSCGLARSFGEGSIRVTLATSLSMQGALTLPFDADELDRLMDAHGLDALLVTSKHNVQYLLGGHRFFWFDYMDA